VNCGTGSEPALALDRAGITVIRDITSLQPAWQVKGVVRGLWCCKVRSLWESPKWLRHVSKTHYIKYRDDGFWAYDVAQGVLLKYLVDVAEARAAQPSMSWLNEATHSWRIGSVLYGLHIDESWSGERLDLLKRLVLEACEQLQRRESISSAEIEAWPMIDDLRIFTRGAKEVATAPVIELGRAVVSLLEGSLPRPPAGTWWCYGFPEGRSTIRKRESSG
jgi:hypothetical protein